MLLLIPNDFENPFKRIEQRKKNKKKKVLSLPVSGSAHSF